MAGKIVKATSAAITAATATGYVTIASTVGWYAGAKGAMTNGGQPNVPVIITEIASATQLGVRILSDDDLQNKPNYGRSNVSAYNGGVLYQHEQFVFNPNDQPLA
jgi:hypothetical protein